MRCSDEARYCWQAALELCHVGDSEKHKSFGLLGQTRPTIVSSSTGESRVHSCVDSNKWDEGEGSWHTKYPPVCSSGPAFCPFGWKIDTLTCSLPFDNTRFQESRRGKNQAALIEDI